MSFISTSPAEVTSAGAETGQGQSLQPVLRMTCAWPLVPVTSTPPRHLPIEAAALTPGVRSAATRRACDERRRGP